MGRQGGVHWGHNRAGGSGTILRGLGLCPEDNGVLKDYKAWMSALVWSRCENRLRRGYEMESRGLPSAAIGRHAAGAEDDRNRDMTEKRLSQRGNERERPP